MSRLDVAKSGRIELRVKDDDRLGPLLTENNLGLHTLAKARGATRRLGSMRKTRPNDPTETVVRTLPELPQRTAGSNNNKLEQVLTNIHQVSQANALLRKKLEVKSQKAALTKENLMMLEENLETNRPAIQLQRKQEFIRKEMEKGRRSAATADERMALLKKIDEREAKTPVEGRKIRSDSVLGDLRKAKFRHLARMAQKRLQSVSPDVMKMEEEKQGIASKLDWYLKFCGEQEEAVEEESGKESCSPY